MEPPNPNKRPRTVHSISSSSTCQNQNPNPNSFPSVPDFNQNHVDLIISSFLSLSDFHSLTSSLSIECSFDRAIDRLFKASTDDESDLDDRTHELASLLHESVDRCSRKRAALHNSDSWSLPYDLTIKVFTNLDTKSLMKASACCTMFNKCAKDPLCYSHIDLTSRYIDDKVVVRMIRRAGKELRTLKLGRIPCHRIRSSTSSLTRSCHWHPNKSTTSLLTSSCLAPLSSNHGFSGNLLESLHLYNESWLDYYSMRDALSSCTNLTDLKIFGWDISPTDRLLEFVPRKCQHLFIEKEIGSGYACLNNCSRFPENCTNITSLSLIGFHIEDSTVSRLINSFHKLKYLNLSSTPALKGRFLRDLECRRGTLLETLILRDCNSLKERPVLQFWDALLKGRFKFIQHIEISSKCGLSSVLGGYCKPKFCLEKLKEKRPGLTFVADFTAPAGSSTWSSSSSSLSLPSDFFLTSSSDSSSSSSSGDDDTSSGSEEND